MPKFQFYTAFLFVVAVGCVGCEKEEAEPTQETVVQAEKTPTPPAAKPAMDDAPEAEPSENTNEEIVVETIEKENGLKIEILEQGSGEKPKTGDVVAVHYRGTLASNGTEFDNSRNHGGPFEFPLGRKKVIQGWDEGIAELNVGSKARLTIPSELGYGSRGIPGVIPGNAVLVFDVELVDIR